MKLDWIKYRDKRKGPTFRLEVLASASDATRIKDATDLLQREYVTLKCGVVWRHPDGFPCPKFDNVRILVSEKMKAAIRQGNAKLLESWLTDAIREQRVSEN
ncbi:MAG: hypothetical protein IIB55_00395 [Planctomycetes bacterium]|nr:hypothetical protein [Planctomycetota bacterium]MCH9057066.1 hypothetical protein [Planctomycetota bacterium]